MEIDGKALPLPQAEPDADARRVIRSLYRQTGRSVHKTMLAVYGKIGVSAYEWVTAALREPD